MEFLHIYLKNVYSNSTLKLIRYFFKDKPEVSIHFLRLNEIGLYYDEGQTGPAAIKNWLCDMEIAIVEHPDEILLEKIRLAAVELIFFANNTSSLIRKSDYISQKLELPYDKISRVYSRHKGHSLEQYLLRLKMEKVKQLLLTTTDTLSEIAYQMDYSSVQYLSNQFKKILGTTVSEFKQTGNPPLAPIETL
jgi:AraC family transcriptional regulator